MPSSLSSPSSQRELLVQPTDSSLTSKELEKLRRLLQQKCRIEYNFALGLSVLRLIPVGHVLQNRKVSFYLIGTIGFHVETKNEIFAAGGSCCRQKLKCWNFRLSCGRLRQEIAPKSVPHVQHDYFSSFNQWNHWFVMLSLPSSFLKLSSYNVITIQRAPWNNCYAKVNKSRKVFLCPLELISCCYFLSQAFVYISQTEYLHLFQGERRSKGRIKSV